MSYKLKKFLVKRKVKAFKFLMDNFNISQKEAQRWMDKNRVIVDGEVLNKKSASIEGEVEVIHFVPSTKNLLPIFETSDFAVFDKPSGVLVHPANRDTEYSLTHEIKYLYGKDANITHRIDKETSGLVLISKNKTTEIEIKRLFEEKRVQKSYLVYVRGEINEKIKIDAPIWKNREFGEIKLKVLIDERGKDATTIIEPINYDPKRDITLLKAIPLTGRQHQIRAHLFHIKHPIIGDPVYGVSTNTADKYLNKKLSTKERIKESGAERLMLHAQTLSFEFRKRYEIVSEMEFNPFSSHQV